MAKLILVEADPSGLGWKRCFPKCLMLYVRSKTPSQVKRGRGWNKCPTCGRKEYVA